MRTSLHQSRVIDYPSFDRSLLPHGGQHVLAHRFQNVFIPLGRMGHDMVQRLMGLAHLVGAETSRHRFPAFAFPGKQQTGAIGRQRDRAIQVPRGYEVGAHDQQFNIKEW